MSTRHDHYGGIEYFQEADAAQHQHDSSHKMADGHHGGHDGHMSMVFHVGHDEIILFKWWQVDTRLALVVSCVCIFILAVLYEGLKLFREWLFRKRKRRLQGGYDNYGPPHSRHNNYYNYYPQPQLQPQPQPQPQPQLQPPPQPQMQPQPRVQGIQTYVYRSPQVQRPSPPQVHRPSPPQVHRPSQPQVRQPSPPRVRRPSPPRVRRPSQPQPPPSPTVYLSDGESIESILGDLAPSSATSDAQTIPTSNVQAAFNADGKSSRPSLISQAWKRGGASGTSRLGGPRNPSGAQGATTPSGPSLSRRPGPPGPSPLLPNVESQETGESFTCDLYLSPLHIAQTFLHMLQVFVAFLLMLIFMTFNVWLCLAVTLGAGFGYLIFFPFITNIQEHCN